MAMAMAMAMTGQIRPGHVTSKSIYSPVSSRREYKFFIQKKEKFSSSQVYPASLAGSCVTL